MFLDLPLFLQQLESAVASDAVREMDDVISLAQLEKAVDDPAQFAPGRPVQLGAMKQFAAADQRDPLRDQPEAGVQKSQAKMEPAGLGQPRGPEYLPQPLDFGGGRRNDVDLLAGAGGVQLVAHLGDVAAETLDRFDPQMTGRFQRSDGNAAERDRRKAVDFGQRRPHAVGVGGILQPFQEMPAFLLDVGRLDQSEPTVADAAAHERERIRQAVISKTDSQDLPIELRTEISQAADNDELAVFAHLDTKTLHFHKAGEHNQNQGDFCFRDF